MASARALDAAPPLKVVLTRFWGGRLSRGNVVDYPYAGGLGISMPGTPGYGKSILGDIYLCGYEFLSRVGNASAAVFKPRLWRCLLMIE